MGDKIRLSLDVSPELNDLLNELARKTGGTKSDVLRKAITLMDVAVDAATNGGKLTIVEPASRPGEPEHTKEIVGLFAARVPSPNSSMYGDVRRPDQDEGMTGALPEAAVDSTFGEMGTGSDRDRVR